MENEVFVISAHRTPIGKIGGAFANIQPDGLLLPLYDDIRSKQLIPLETINEVIIGQAKQTQDQSNIARYSLLSARFPESIPGYTVNRQCGSGMQAIQNAYMGIKAGLADVVIAGGVESMSTAPYYLRSARFGYRSGNAELLDPNKESQPGSQPSDIYGRLTMGLTAENLVQDYDISRKEQDVFALNSQQKAANAIQNDLFKNEIIPVNVPQRKGVPKPISQDEHPRETNLDMLASLKPVFLEGGTVTAGNSSGLNDGASMLLLVSKQVLKQYNLSPLAKIIGIGVSGVAPDRMGIGPVQASRYALQSASLTLDDIDLIELNEAFAAQSLAVIKELQCPLEKVNVNGGAIALGHPIGNSGSRICVSLIHALRYRKKKYGLATLCTAGGQGIATVIENCM
ncbi:acetyl-CoA acetyltransferase [Bacillus sp. SA1-12]|uniref:thiolase family protein n=1 Tax=Bacillus sp. SA1-12 TaxID=1455638 RepID=UPI00062744D2|nr:thiolase family protein [Bacillus sp. SA1-12]KKI90429.1 acetyl-CoA acetyltransferase [Bacillus sp. SA1-12]